MNIVSLAPSNTEILFALGMGKHIVGKTTQCDYPGETKSIRSVGGWVNLRDMGFLDELQPDVVVTSMYLPDALQEACDQRGITLIHVVPQTIDGIYKSILTIGRFLDKKAEALDIVTEVKSHLHRIRTTAKHNITTKLRVYCEEWHDPPTVSANWVPELVEIAGGKSLGHSGIFSYEVTTDIVRAFDPQIIIGHWCGFGTRSRLGVIQQRPEWQGLSAIQHNAIYSVDDSLLNRPGPRIWQGAAAIQELLKNHQ